MADGLKFSVQFTNGEAVAALVAARRLALTLRDDEPYREEFSQLVELIEKAYDGIDLAMISDARRSVQLPRVD